MHQNFRNDIDFCRGCIKWDIDSSSLPWILVGRTRPIHSPPPRQSWQPRSFIRSSWNGDRLLPHWDRAWSTPRVVHGRRESDESTQNRREKNSSKQDKLTAQILTSSYFSDSITAFSLSMDFNTLFATASLRRYFPSMWYNKREPRRTFRVYMRNFCWNLDNWSDLLLIRLNRLDNGAAFDSFCLLVIQPRHSSLIHRRLNLLLIGFPAHELPMSKKRLNLALWLLFCYESYPFLFVWLTPAIMARI